MSNSEKVLPALSRRETQMNGEEEEASLSPVRMARTKPLAAPSPVRSGEPDPHVRAGRKWHRQFLVKQNVPRPRDPAVALLSIHPRDMGRVFTQSRTQVHSPAGNTRSRSVVDGPHRLPHRTLPSTHRPVTTQGSPKGITLKGKQPVPECDLVRDSIYITSLQGQSSPNRRGRRSQGIGPEIG